MHVEIAHGRASHGGDYDGLTLLVDGVALLRGAAIDVAPTAELGLWILRSRPAPPDAPRRVR